MKKGFSTVELIIYMGILTILLTVLTGIFTSIIDVQLTAKATSSVDQDGRYILTRLAYDMHSASAINIPLAGSQSASLQITVDSVVQTYSLDGSGHMQLNKNSLTDNLNSVETSISDLSFRRIGIGDNHDTIQMQFTVTSKTKKRADRSEAITFKTTIGRQ